MSPCRSFIIRLRGGTPEQEIAIESELKGKGTYPVLILYTPNDSELQSEKANAGIAV